MDKTPEDTIPSDRRVAQRRIDAAVAYTGPERRKHDRRDVTSPITR